jgi:hypothetical protein
MQLNFAQILKISKSLEKWWGKNSPPEFPVKPARDFRYQNTKNTVILSFKHYSQNSAKQTSIGQWN